MQAIVLAFTTSSYVLGPDGEQALKARLEKRSNGIPVLTIGAAAVAAFRALGEQGFNVVYASQMRLRGLEARSRPIRYDSGSTQFPAVAHHLQTTVGESAQCA